MVQNTKISNGRIFQQPRNQTLGEQGQAIVSSVQTQKISDALAKKPEITQRIQDARSQGGLEENEELLTALDDMQTLDMELHRLQEILETATINSLAVFAAFCEKHAFIKSFLLFLSFTQ